MRYAEHTLQYDLVTDMTSNLKLDGGLRHPSFNVTFERAQIGHYSTSRDVAILKIKIFLS